MLATLCATLLAADSPCTSIVFEAKDTFGGCVVADVDPGHPGNEVVVTSATGVVTVLVPGSHVPWTSVVAFRGAGELIQVAAGDADPRRPGNEIVAVGMAEGPEDDGGPGAAVLLFRDGESWKSTTIFEEDALVHGVAIGAEGVYVAGFDRRVTLLRPTGAGGAFENVASAELPGAGKSVLAAPGGGAFVACLDGSLAKATLGKDGKLSVAVVDRRESGRARLGTDGEKLVVCDDDGTLSVVWPADGKRRELFRESPKNKKLRGAVFADLDASSPGTEIATTGYSGRVVVLRRRGGADAGEFDESVVFRDVAGFHHAAAGDLDGRPGDELVVCGFAGRVVVISF